MIVFSIFAILSSHATVVKSENYKQNFHPPQTEAEKALDEILWITSGLAVTTKHSSENGLPLEYWLDINRLVELYHGNTKSYITEKHLKIFTKDLNKAYTYDVQFSTSRKCDKACHDYELNKILCAHDFMDNVYRTTFITKNEAVIQATSAEYKSDTSTYKLKKESDIWKLDGVRCCGSDACSINPEVLMR